MSKNPLRELTKFDQSIWLDYIRRDMLINGKMERLIHEDKVKGVTSNPAIFQKAFDSGDFYDAAIRAQALQGKNAEQIYQSLAIEDIQFATDLYRPIYDKTNGGDGFVSLEVSPELAHNTRGTINEARDLWKRVNRPNALIKVPGTKEGLAAIEQLISEGINVNVTLLFGLERYRAVTDAYISGLEKRAKSGKPIDNIASVASFFLSRIDVLVDPMIEKHMDGKNEKATLAKKLHGQVAIASAKKAYQIYKEVFESPRFKKLAEKGAATQRVLWASTSTKNPDYSDVKYVEALIGPKTVNTIPQETVEAYRDHGQPQNRLEDDLDQVDYVLDNLSKLDINLKEVTQQLEDEGVEKFKKPFKKLLEVLEKQRKEALKLDVDTIDLEQLGDYKTSIKKQLISMKGERFNQRIWNKDGSLWKDDKEDKDMIPDALGWLSVATKMMPKVPQLEHFVHEVREAGYTNVVHMGMGGSSLAPLVFERTFEKVENGLELTVLDTTDPATIKKVEKQVPLDKTLFIVASKSGTTAEPNAFGDYFYHKLKEKIGDEAGAHFTVITDPDTPLVDKAKNRNYQKIFLNFKDIGGRYSALSYFGMVPAALMGLDIGGLLERSLRMSYACNITEDPAKNPALQLGAAMGNLTLQGRDKLTLVLPKKLATLGMWLEQLVAESTGKEGKGILPVTGEALLKPEAYGDDRQFVHVHLKGHKNAALHKKLDALAEAGHPVVTVTMHELEDISQEFYRWEMAVAAAGAIIGINAFNQPNVQGSKDATHRLLKKADKGEDVSGAKPLLKEDGMKFFAPDVKADSARSLLQQFFGQADAGQYIAIQAYLTENDETEKALQELRTALQKRYQVATTIGYGPRFLHSTGQYHKGGPNTGLFLQLTASNEPDVEVPDKNYNFSTFKQAQAAGDLEALQEHKRRTLRVDISSDHIPKALAAFKEWIEK